MDLASLELSSRTSKSAGACDLFIGEVQNIGPLFGMFYSDGTYISLAVEIQHGVFIKFPGLGDFPITERQIKGIRFLEIFDLYNVNDRSKNALWTSISTMEVDIPGL